MVIVFSISLFILPSKRNIKVKADVSQPYNKSYMSQYFYDLENNFPKNVYGTCGYVAISMLLQYYDNYLNANIISESYEFTENLPSGNDFRGANRSPGVRRAGVNYGNNVSFVATNNTTPNVYYTTMIEESDTYLQGKLFEIAQQKWYLPESNFTEDSGGLTRGGILNVLRGYLDSLGYSENSEEEGENSSLEVGEYEITQCIEGWLWGNEEEDLKQFTKQKILQGYPVLLAVSREKTEEDKVYDGTAGHAIIAYDYDIATDTIYCHSGWGSFQHSTVEAIGYQYWDFALVLDINLPHACDNNYIVDGVGYCFHNEEVVTYEHTHDFNACIATENIDGEILHTAKCSTCFEIKDGILNHIYSYTYYSDTLHRAHCSCGDLILESHAINVRDIVTDVSGKRWGTCIKCGRSISLEFGFGEALHPTDLTIVKRSVNGSEMLPNGIILLVEEDIDAYLNGTLVFYNTQDNEMSIL